jgi:hypothetical protein
MSSPARGVSILGGVFRLDFLRRLIDCGLVEPHIDQSMQALCVWLRIT